MKEQLMVQSPTFEVNLGGIDLTEPQAKELEKAIQQTTLQFLAKLDNGFLKDVFEFKPQPDSDGDPNPQPSRVLDKKWWLGQSLLRLQANQLVRPEVMGGLFRPDIAKTFKTQRLG